MVAVITATGGRNVAVHRTWLEVQNLACEPAPRVGKAPLGRDAKMTLGSYAGGCIRLGRGESGRAWRDMRPGETLLIAEGIEDTLTGMLLQPQYRAVAAVSLSAMKALELPPQVTRIILMQQNDAHSSDEAVRAARQICERWHHQGRRVVLWQPPAWAKDFNDELQRRSRGAEDVGRYA